MKPLSIPGACGEEDKERPDAVAGVSGSSGDVAALVCKVGGLHLSKEDGSGSAFGGGISPPRGPIEPADGKEGEEGPPASSTLPSSLSAVPSDGSPLWRRPPSTIPPPLSSSRPPRPLSQRPRNGRMPLLVNSAAS